MYQWADNDSALVSASLNLLIDSYFSDHECVVFTHSVLPVPGRTNNRRASL